MFLAFRRWAAAFLGAAALAACTYRTVGVRTVESPAAAEPVTVTSPVKAHLLDGSTAIFPGGVTLAGGELQGAGNRVGLRLEPLGHVERLSLDSVIGMETYEQGVNTAATVALTTLGLAVGAVATAALAVAIFGSCPTFYADSAGSWALEAEGFSYSIAALYESRDVDRLRTTLRPDGTVQIEVRNEALETHFINQLELLDVHHAPGELVLPDADGKPVAVGVMQPAIQARSGDLDLLPLLAAADGNVTREDLPEGELAPAALDRGIDLELPVPVGADSMAVVLRLRNSLLNTVLLYDVMLGSRGLKSLEWQATTLREIGPALEVAQWYSGNMGLRLLEVTPDGTREVAHLRDTGPIAFKDVALVIAAPETRTIRLRLESVVDNWRIDQLSVATVRRPAMEVLPLAATLDPSGSPIDTVLQLLARADGQYLQTLPGQRFTAVWQPTPMSQDSSRTFLLASQGYYSEWMRRSWIEEPRDTAAFVPDRSAIATAVTLWRNSRDSLERRFYDSRLPVR